MVPHRPIWPGSNRRPSRSFTLQDCWTLFTDFLLRCSHFIENNAFRLIEGRGFEGAPHKQGLMVVIDTAQITDIRHQQRGSLNKITDVDGELGRQASDQTYPCPRPTCWKESSPSSCSVLQASQVWVHDSFSPAPAQQIPPYWYWHILFAGQYFLHELLICKVEAGLEWVKWDVHLFWSSGKEFQQEIMS